MAGNEAESKLTPPLCVLFICSGNTCRSPMAEALLLALAAEDLDGKVAVASAGTSAWDGAPASEGARRAAESSGLSLEEHRSRRLTRELLEHADLVLAMEAKHAEAARRLHPGRADRVHLLTAFASDRGPDEGRAIMDPFGGDADLYARTFEDIRVSVEAALERLREMIAPGEPGEGT